MFNTILLILFSIFIVLKTWNVIDMISDSKSKDYVHKALTNHSSYLDQEYIVKYAQGLMKSVKPDYIQNLFQYDNDRSLIYEFSYNYALNRSLQALTLPDYVSDIKLSRKYNGDFADIQIDVIDLIDQVKVVIMNSNTGDFKEIETARKDLLLFLLSIMELNYAYYAFRISNSSRIGINIQIEKILKKSQKHKKQPDKFLSPDEWVDALKKHKESTGRINTSRLTDEWCETLLHDLHRLDKYFDNFDEIVFSTVENIFIYYKAK